ncbi:division/cell wall cluster transcriptional repressor MraZ [Eubacteriales bacterium KG127]
MGTYNNSIDAKNRMIVPAKHRDGLGGRCILTKGLDKCLYIYTTDDWEKQMEKIASMPESDPKVRAFIRHFCANAVECEFDKQGRIVIPAELREYGDFTKELVTMGAMRKIEIWAKEVWDSSTNGEKLDSESFSEALAMYNF